MVIEYIRYWVPAALPDQPEAAWSIARKVLDEVPQCSAYEAALGVEDPADYVVGIEEMRHYTSTAIASAR
jgi:hypothetical protein